jgi:predicted PurR-regulated permease PerM
MKSNLNVFFLFALIVLVGVLTYFVLQPFLKALFLAFIIYQLFKKWHKKIEKKIGNRPSIASLVTCFILFFILIIPFLATTALVTKEATNLYKEIQTTNFQPYTESITNLPVLENFNLNPENFDFKNMAISNSEKITQGTQGIGGFIFTIVKSIYQETSHLLFMIFVMFFTLYYLFKDGERIIKKVMDLSPLKNKQEYKLLDNFVKISKATLKGSLVIAIIQGILMTIIFWITGVSSPVLWGVITLLVSLIPVIGSILVWLPVGITMFFMGYIGQAIAIFAFGLIVISSVDNVLRPKLVGDESSLHPILVFFSTLGGLAFFGITGFLLGPVVIVLLLSLLDIYKNEFKGELKKFNQ